VGTVPSMQFSRSFSPTFERLPSTWHLRGYTKSRLMRLLNEINLLALSSGGRQTVGTSPLEAVAGGRPGRSSRSPWKPIWSRSQAEPRVRP